MLSAPLAPEPQPGSALTPSCCLGAATAFTLGEVEERGGAVLHALGNTTELPFPPNTAPLLPRTPYSLVVLLPESTWPQMTICEGRRGAEGLRGRTLSRVCACVEAGNQTQTRLAAMRTLTDK